MTTLQQGQKRNRPTSGPAEAEGDGQRYRRISEVLSDCNSDTLPVERIHSGLPALPEKLKGEGAFEAAEAPVNRGGARASDESGYQTIAPQYAFIEATLPGGPTASSARTRSADPPQFRVAPTATPRSFTRDHGDQMRAENGFVFGAAGSDGVRARRLNDGVFTTLSFSALQQQMGFLMQDEQALLAELRTARRDYDTRVQELSRVPLPTRMPLPAASQPSAAPAPQQRKPFSSNPQPPRSVAPQHPDPGCAFVDARGQKLNSSAHFANRQAGAAAAPPQRAAAKAPSPSASSYDPDWIALQHPAAAAAAGGRPPRPANAPGYATAPAPGQMPPPPAPGHAHASLAGPPAGPQEQLLLPSRVALQQGYNTGNGGTAGRSGAKATAPRSETVLRQPATRRPRLDAPGPPVAPAAAGAPGPAASGSVLRAPPPPPSHQELAAAAAAGLQVQQLQLQQQHGSSSSRSLLADEMTALGALTGLPEAELVRQLLLTQLLQQAQQH